MATRRRGDPSVFAAASPATTLNLAQGLFGSLDSHDVRWVAALAAEPGLLAVRADAPWESLEALMDQWRREPASVVAAGGSAVASQDHVKLLLLAEAGGVDPLQVRYVPFDGGGEALAATLGGFVDLFSGELSEALPHLESGAARVLAVMSEEPLSPPLDHLPTTFQAGYAVEWATWRGFYLPGAVSDSVYDAWVQRFLALGSSPEWESVRRTYRWEPFVLVGPEFETFVEGQVETFQRLARRMGLIP
jgi:putative tricarboxylic transport membrane protein